MVGENTTLEKSLVGRFHLLRVSQGEKVPNLELTPKSVDITCGAIDNFFVDGVQYTSC